MLLALIWTPRLSLGDVSDQEMSASALKGTVQTHGEERFEIAIPRYRLDRLSAMGGGERPPKCL